MTEAAQQHGALPIVEAIALTTGVFLLSIFVGVEWTRVHVLPSGAALLAVYVAGRVAPSEDEETRAPSEADVVRAASVFATTWLAWLAYGALLVDPLNEPIVGWIASGILALVAVLSFVPAIPLLWSWGIFGVALVLPRLPHVSVGLGIAGLAVRGLAYAAVSLVLLGYRSGDAPLRTVLRTAWLLLAEHALISAVGAIALSAYVLIVAARAAQPDWPRTLQPAPPPAFARIAARDGARAEDAVRGTAAVRVLDTADIERALETALSGGGRGGGGW